MPRVKARVLPWASDEPQPGLVEVSLVDAHGTHLRFVDKSAVVTDLLINAQSAFPVDIQLPVLERGRASLANGSPIVRVSVDPRLGMETVDGVADFDVLSSDLSSDLQEP